MTCEHIRGDLHPLLDHELDAAARSEVLGHLDVCQSCQEEYAAQRQLKTLLAAHLAEGPAPARLWQAILQRIEEDAPRAPGARGRWRLAASARWRAAAVMCAVLMVAVVAFVVSGSRRLTSSAALTASLIDEIIRDHRASMARANGPADIRGGDPVVVRAGLQTRGPLPGSTLALPREVAQLLGGSFCRFQPTTGIRLTYRLGDDRMVSFYQLRHSPQVAVPSSTVHRRYLEVLDDNTRPHLILWGDEHTLYALVGEAPVDELRQLVSRL